MKVLLDSHVFLWILFSPDRVGEQARRAIADASEVMVSSASLWELALQHAKGNLSHSPEQLSAGISALRATELPVAVRHVVHLPDVELPHNDPFDRMLVAQAIADGAVLVTADATLTASVHATLDARA